jgi:hypothetical protein
LPGRHSLQEQQEQQQQQPHSSSNRLSQVHSSPLDMSQRLTTSTRRREMVHNRAREIGGSRVSLETPGPLPHRGSHRVLYGCLTTLLTPPRAERTSWLQARNKPTAHNLSASFAKTPLSSAEDARFGGYVLNVGGHPAGRLSALSVLHITSVFLWRVCMCAQGA